MAAPVFTVAEAFEAVQEDCQSANAVIEVMSEVETVKDAAVQCQVSRVCESALPRKH